MSPDHSLCLYAALAYSVWQVAHAAPTIARGSAADTLGAPGFHQVFNSPSNFMLGSNPRDRLDPSKSFNQIPHEETVTFMEDDRYNEAHMFAWSNTRLLKQAHDSPAQSLGFDTAHQWEPLVQQYRKLTGGKIGSLKDWLEKNNVLHGRNSAQEVSDLEWLFLRAGSPQGIWWEGRQLASWRESNYDWKGTIMLGDLLQFDQARRDLEMSKTRIKTVQKELIPLLENGKWTQPFFNSFFSGANGAESSREFQVLRSISGELSLYDKRIGQVVHKIVRKMDQHQGDRAQLPADLKSDLYLLALLRGKVLKSPSDAQLHYVVAIPDYTVTVHKPFDGKEIRASFRFESRGRVLPETYVSGQATAAPANGRAAKVWSTSPGHSQSDNSQVITLPPTGSTSQLDGPMRVSPTESPSGFFASIKKKKTKHRVIVNDSDSAASRVVTPWAVPAGILETLVKMVTNSVSKRQKPVSLIEYRKECERLS